MREVVQQAKEAQLKFLSYTQKQIDQMVKHVAYAAYEQSEYLASMAVQETNMGVVAHKKIKNELASLGVYESIKDEKTVGIIREIPQKKIIEIAYPYGVIAGVTPTTNPTSTAIYKVLISLKSQNAIVLSPHPSAVKCTVEALNICNQAAIKAGAPEGLIGWINDPSLNTTSELMKHKDINLILATGGSSLVRAAYSSGKPAYGVGPGNVPVYVEKSANIKKAVKAIMESKTFDHGTICATEQAIVVDKEIKDLVVEELKQNGAYFVSASEKSKLEKVISPEKGRLNPKIVGRSAKKISEMAGISVPASTRLLIAEEKRIGKEFPLSLEKLSPIFAFYTAREEQEAEQICTELLNLGGRGHSFSIHTNDKKVVERFGLAMPVSRILVNTLASIGAAGATTGLKPSLTLGCGSYGGNITSDNISAKHLINLKRVAYGIKAVTLPESDGIATNEDVATTEENIDLIIDQVLKEVGGGTSIDGKLVSKMVKEVMEQWLKK